MFSDPSTTILVTPSQEVKFFGEQHITDSVRLLGGFRLPQGPAGAIWRWPKACKLLFHPGEDDTAKALALALGVFAVVVLLLAGCGLLYTARHAY